MIAGVPRGSAIHVQRLRRRGFSCRGTPSAAFAVRASTAWARDPRTRPDLRSEALRSVPTPPRLTAAHARRAAASPSNPVLSLVTTGPKVRALAIQRGARIRLDDGRRCVRAGDRGRGRMAPARARPGGRWARQPADPPGDRAGAPVAARLVLFAATTQGIGVDAGSFLAIVATAAIAGTLTAVVGVARRVRPGRGGRARARRGDRAAGARTSRRWTRSRSSSPNLGLGMLFFFAGYEIDIERIRGEPLRLAVGGLGAVARDRLRARRHPGGGRRRRVAGLRRVGAGDDRDRHADPRPVGHGRAGHGLRLATCWRPGRSASSGRSCC